MRWALRQPSSYRASDRQWRRARAARQSLCSIPSDRRRQIGEASEATDDDVRVALELAAEAQPAWDARGGVMRADILERASDVFEENRAAADGPAGPRGGPHRGQCVDRGARSGRLPALLRQGGARAFLRRARRFRDPWANRTSSSSTGAASSCASRRGIFRSRSSPGRSQPRLRPATACSPSPPSRRP